MVKSHNERDWIMLLSGLVWIPYSLLMLYLFIEQYRFKRFPQHAINLCLFLGCCCRTIWFFGYEDLRATEALVYLNRIAILLQFSALSILMMMWSRVLRVSNNSVNNSSSQFNINNPANLKAGASKSESQLNSPTHELTDTGLVAHNYLTATIIANVVVWLFVIVSIALSFKVYPALYNVNIIILATVCLLEGVSIFCIGVNTGMRISRELAPVYPSWSKENLIQKSQCQKIKDFGYEFYLVFFAQSMSSTHRLHAQAEAIYRLLLVSSVIAFFFLVRFFSFIYLLFISP